jgi:DNA-binding NarL/FixJ family response regulator
MTPYHPVFATRQALRIAPLRHLLTAAGIDLDPQVVYPEEVERAVASEGECLVLIDGQCMPPQDVLLRLRRSSPGSRLVLWTDRLTTDLLLATMECDLAGLLSSRLSDEDAAAALAGICRGERILRFDSDPLEADPIDNRRQVAEAPSFDAQWMLHGAESTGRQT